MRVGLFGGTFDPVHLGHMRAAESARVVLGLERVFLVPSARPPHRDGAVSGALDRFAMAALAAAGSTAFVASDVEMRRDGPSYTVETVEALKAEQGLDEIVLLLGSDAFAEIGSWREAERLLRMVEVGVIPRPGFSGPMETPRGARVRVIEGPQLLLSSTSIRALVRGGGSVRFLVPNAVEDYIRKKGLYL